MRKILVYDRMNDDIKQQLCSNDMVLVSYDERNQYVVDAYLMNHPDIKDLDNGMKMPFKKLLAIVEKSRLPLYSALYDKVFFISDECENLKLEIENLISHGSKKKTVFSFTDTERKVLRVLSFGASTQDISDELYMTERSIRRIKEKLLKKTGLKNSIQLSLYAFILEQRVK